MIKRKVLFCFLLLASCFLLLAKLFSFPILAVSSYEELVAKQKEIEEIEKKIADLKKQERDLTAQIALFDNQIKLTTLQIEKTEGSIVELESEIATLSAKISRLDTSLDRVSAILINRVSETYKTGKVDPLVLFFSSDSFTQFLSRYKYLKVIQLHDKKLLLAMEETKTNYEAQKSLKEEKQEELEQLRKLLESQKKKLNDQKKDKEYLLVVTKQDKEHYEQLKKAAQAEAAAMEAAMAQALALLKDGTPIEAGQEIALIGNTGSPCCSTGDHLHFEIRKDSQPQNPAGYLSNIPVEYEGGPVGRMNFTGDWPWPIETPRITQEYGISYWAKLGWYQGGPHTGIDMISSNHIIKAPKGGTLYRSTTRCCSARCSQGCATIKFVAIDHGNGLISWYWHVQ